MTLREALGEAERRLAAAGCETPGLDARVLLKHVTGRTDAGLIAGSRDPLDDGERRRFEDLVARRADRVPVAYLTGHREFFSVELEVSPAVLVPRPETETLVEAALEFLRGRSGSGPVTVVDVGTGTGAIPLALASEWEPERASGADLRLVAVDCSADALSVARRNAARGAPGRVALLRGDLSTALRAARVDLLLSNPPYLTPAEIAAGAPELAFEPRLALDGQSSDGLHVVRRVLQEAARVLRPRARTLVEIGAEQARAVEEFALGLGFHNVEVLRDLGGRPRVLRADRP